MITEDYVSYETAKLLKDKGFDEPCLMCYTSDKKIGNYGHYNSYKNSDVFAITAPTLQKAMKWLREVQYLWVDIDPVTGYKWTWSIWFMNEPNSKMGESSQVISTYREACEAAIKYCLENLI